MKQNGYTDYYDMKYLQTIVIGALCILAGSLIPHIFESIPATFFAGVLFAFVWWGAKKVGKHFCFDHTHEGDSELDRSIIVTLFMVNMLHPLVDGFALYGTYSSQNRYLFTSVLVGVLVHEIFRQSALTVVFRQFGFSAWKVVLPAFSGMAFGWLLGVLGGNLPESIEPYIDAVTFAAYAFIILEHFFAHPKLLKNKAHKIALIAGLLIAAIFILFFSTH